MTRPNYLHQRILREARAVRAFENHAAKLEHELSVGVAPLEQMRLRVELLEGYVEQTGGNLLTERFRVTLADLKKRVVLRGLERARRHVTALVRSV
jgi:hypothetical protein